MLLPWQVFDGDWLPLQVFLQENRYAAYFLLVEFEGQENVNQYLPAAASVQGLVGLRNKISSLLQLR